MTGFKINEYGRSDFKRAYSDFWVEMFPVVVRAVEQTFRVDGATMANPTQAEVKDRVNKAKRIVDELRNDLKWSKPRIKAELTRILLAKLLGQKLDLDDETKRGQKTIEKVRGEYAGEAVTSLDNVTTVGYAAEGAPEIQASERTKRQLARMYDAGEEADLGEPSVEADPEQLRETADPEDLDL